MSLTETRVNIDKNTIGEALFVINKEARKLSEIKKELKDCLFNKGWLSSISNNSPSRLNRYIYEHMDKKTLDPILLKGFNIKNGDFEIDTDDKIYTLDSAYVALKELSFIVLTNRQNIADYNEKKCKLEDITEFDTIDEYTDYTKNCEKEYERISKIVDNFKVIKNQLHIILKELSSRIISLYRLKMNVLNFENLDIIEYHQFTNEIGFVRPYYKLGNYYFHGMRYPDREYKAVNFKKEQKIMGNKSNLKINDALEILYSYYPNDLLNM